MRPVSLRIALVGAPQVGKTVYANVLYELLLDARAPSGLRFVPESSSAKSVVAAIRGLSRGKWPKATRSDGVYQYRGSIERVGPTLFSRLWNGRQQYRLEIGDAAGELWTELAESDVEDQILDSNFFDYAVESDVLLLFVSAERMTADPSRVRPDVDDMVGILRLLSATRGSDRPLPPVGIVISKSDLLDPQQRAWIMSLVENDVPLPHGQREGRFEEALAQLERLLGVATRLSPRVELFVVSSLDAALDTGMADATLLGVPPRSEIEKLGHRQAIYPLLWSLRQSRRGR